MNGVRPTRRLRKQGKPLFWRDRWAVCEPHWQRAVHAGCQSDIPARNNKGNGTFEEVGVAAGIAYNEAGKSIAGMGVDFRDVDNDGRPDIFLVGMVGDTFPLFRNTGKDFEDVTSAWGCRAGIRLVLAIPGPNCRSGSRPAWVRQTAHGSAAQHRDRRRDGASPCCPLPAPRVSLRHPASLLGLRG